MRLFALLNFQDIVLYLFPSLIFVLLFGLALSFASFRAGGSKCAKETAPHEEPEDIQGGNEPVPVFMILTIAGTVVWAFFYILATGLLEVKI